MKIVIAPDKFKGSLTSFEVCDAIEKGLLKACAAFDVMKLPMADGGDGLSDVIVYYTNAKLQAAKVQDPLGRIIDAQWLLSADRKTAFIEMAKASGLQLLKPGEYNPLLASTFGTGQLIEAAINAGVQNIILGIGGSATNDGGMGMAAALGYRFLDTDEKEIFPAGNNLARIERIEVDKVKNLNSINFKIGCDVQNLLFGETGAARMYAPQKGADSSMVEELEKGMKHFASIVKRDLGVDVSAIAGGGAAGGMGAGCVAFLNAHLVSGVDLVMELAAAENQIKNCDVVITGEGKIDDQSLHGKLVSGIASLCKMHSKRLIGVCGVLSIDQWQLKQLGFESVYSILNNSKSVSEAMENANDFLSDLGFTIGNNLLRKSN